MHRKRRKNSPGISTEQLPKRRTEVKETKEEKKTLSILPKEAKIFQTQ